MPAKQSKTRKSPAALAGLGLAVLAVSYFAVQGGEYGTTDLVRQRARMALLQHEVDSLQRQVDSLGRYKQSIETDPLVQERLAREEFGMIKGDKEILYRFADAPVLAAGKR
jgi:cell division protein FtsB